MIHALILIDLQKDFFSDIFPLTYPKNLFKTCNTLIRTAYDTGQLLLSAEDSHPIDHGSFASTHKLPPFTLGKLSNNPQILWPLHCVENTEGAEHHQSLLDTPIVFSKGFDHSYECYSAFFDQTGVNPTGVHKYLHEYKIQEITLVGSALNFGVKHTALDGRRLGYKVNVILDGCGFMGVDGESFEETVSLLINNKVKVI